MSADKPLSRTDTYARDRRDRRGRDLLTVGVATVLALVLESGYLLFSDSPRRREAGIADWRAKITLIIDDRRTAIEAWVRERKGDASVLADDPRLGMPLAAEPEHNTAALSDLVGRLNGMVRHFGYEAAFVVDAGGAVLARSAGSRYDNALAAVSSRAANVVVPVVDFDRLDDGRGVITIAAPIDRQPHTGPRARLILLFDPRTSLHPILDPKVTGATSGDLLLARRDGDSASALTPLRHLTAPPMTVRRPLGETVLAIPAAYRPDSFFEYLDYRRVPVLGAMRPIRGTRWVLIAKIDEHEALAATRQGTRRLALLLFGSTLLLSFAALALLRSHRLAALRDAEQRFRALFDHSVNGVLLVEVLFDEVGRPIDHIALMANAAYERLTGVAMREATGKRGAEMPIQWPPELVTRLYAVATGGEPFRYEHLDGAAGRWYETRVYSPQHGQFAHLLIDITDRKLAEIALRESELRHSALSDHSLLGVFSIDQGRLTYVNDAAAAMLGYATGELIGRDPLSIVDADDQALIAQTLRQFAEGSVRSLAFEFRGRCKDGGTKYFQTFAARVVLEDVPTVIGNIIDVTRNRHTEIALREGEENYRRIVESANEGIWQVDAGFRTTYVNRRMVELLGEDAAAMIGRSMAEFLPDEELARHLREMDVLVAGLPTMFERRLRCKDGSVIDCIASVAPILDHDGMLAGALAMFTDVTDMRFADRQVRRLAATVEQSSESIVILDPHGRVEYANPAFERMTGHEREEAVGKEWSLLLRSPDFAPSYADVWRTVQRGESWQGLLHTVRKDGAPFESDATVSPVRDVDGAIVNFVAIARDVTRERALAAQLQHAQKMEAVGTLAGGIAHDFNNLLQGMTMLVQAVSRTPDLPPKPASLVGELAKLVRRGSALTKQLLLFSRKDVVRTELLDLNHVLRESTTLLRRLLRENVAFIAALGDEVLAVNADPHQLQQVLVNLIMNAADAMPAGGRIVLASGRDARGGCWFTVDDTGHGIPPAIRERVFEPFFTTKGRDKGTGLGLSVVHGIVLEHGGTVEFDDRSEGGTRFRVSLPPADIGSNGTRQEQAETPPARGGGERLLVIEDEEAVRNGLVAMLTTLDYRVVAVPTGESALALPDAPRFDIALSDVVLPGLSGPVVTRMLQQRWPDLKTILMSGYVDDDALRRNLPAGTSLLLTKPFEIGTLSKILREVIERPAPPDAPSAVAGEQSSRAVVTSYRTVSRNGGPE